MNQHEMRSLAALLIGNQRAVRASDSPHGSMIVLSLRSSKDRAATPYFGANRTYQARCGNVRRRGLSCHPEVEGSILGSDDRNPLQTEYWGQQG